VLSNNQIESLDLPRPIPTTVTHFDLRNNKITTISSAFFRGAEKLADLNLSGNQIKTHPSELRELPNLKETDFTGNPMELVVGDILRDTFTTNMSNLSAI
jgi:Leucine-rich repeat (LRR) protein